MAYAQTRICKKINVSVLSIVVGALRMVSKRLEKRLAEPEIRRSIETIQITTLLKSARILRRFLETWCYSDFSEKKNTC